MWDKSLHKIKSSADWNIKPEDSEILNKLEIDKYTAYLKEHGYRNSTIIGYASYLSRYLRFVKTSRPTLKDADLFYKTIATSNLGRSTINQYSYSIKAYHKMLGEEYNPNVLKLDKHIPHYFTKGEIEKIFSVIHNLKHLAMFMTGFYSCLRSSELINIQDEDLNLKDLSIRINCGKGGKDGIVFINDECAQVLTTYLRIRPPLEIDGKHYLFYSDFGKRMSKESLYEIFQDYKRKAGITKKGGPHVFFRTSTATLMIANGCDIRIVKDILRHNDIRTTLRYVFVEDKTRREKYEKYLVL